MDAEERDRREEIERREGALYKKLDNEATEREEADRRIYAKIDQDTKALYDRMEEIESKLQDRDRDIENESRNRDQSHDKSIERLTAKLEDHVNNQAVHKKPAIGMETLQGMQRPDFGQLRPPYQQQQPSGIQHQPSGIQQQQPPDDEWARKGVPWWANPKWLVAVGGAIAAIITAVALALSHFRKEDHPPPQPPPHEVPAAVVIE